MGTDQNGQVLCLMHICFCSMAVLHYPLILCTCISDLIRSPACPLGLFFKLRSHASPPAPSVLPTSPL